MMVLENILLFTRVKQYLHAYVREYADLQKDHGHNHDHHDDDHDDQSNREECHELLPSDLLHDYSGLFHLLSG